jgi:hypothetical protein
MTRIMLLILALCPLALAQQQCSIFSARGTYAVSYDGWALIPQPGAPFPLTLPGVILGVVSIGFNGTVSGAETVIIAGQVVEHEIVGGSLDLKEDCTGTMRSLVKVKGVAAPPTEISERVIVLPHENEIRTTVVGSTNPLAGAMGLGIWKRMSPVPNSAKW